MVATGFPFSAAEGRKTSCIPCKYWKKKLGYTFRCKEQLQAALYHSSYANEHRCCGVSSNERLEFLGDAVLGLVTADYLYHKHPDLPEGDLTRMRAAWCARRACTRWPEPGAGQ